MTAEMDMIGRLYHPGLVVINVADPAVMGPDEAAFVVQQYLRPQTVLLTHVNEQATSGGRLIGGTRADRFTRLLRGAGDGAHIEVAYAVSDMTQSFDGEGRRNGCR